MGDILESHFPNVKLPIVLIHPRIKDAGIVIRHSRGYIISRLQCPERGWRGWTSGYTLTKRKLSLGKRYFVGIEKYAEDVKKDQKTIQICWNE